MKRRIVFFVGSMALLSCISISGCGTITSKGISDAQKTCEKHGGLKTISPLFINESDKSEFTCMNGMSFKIR